MRGRRALSQLRSFEDLDLVAGLELDDRLLPAGARALERAAPLRLRLHLDDVDADDLDVEELLDGLADLRLVRVLVHLERVAVLRDLLVALLRDHGTDQHLARMKAHRAPAFPCTSGSAASLTTSDRAHTTCATSSSAGTVTSTRSRLRNDLISASSSSVATISVGACAPQSPRTPAA